MLRMGATGVSRWPLPLKRKWEQFAPTSGYGLFDGISAQFERFLADLARSILFSVLARCPRTPLERYFVSGSGIATDKVQGAGIGTD